MSTLFKNEYIGGLENREERAVPTPRDYQVFARDVLDWEVVDLLQDEDVQGHRLLSRADLILIFSVYNKSGLEGYLEEYKRYANEKKDQYGDNAIILKPHHYLKALIG